MIVSASRRTDIPRFYFEWFMNRIREGFVEVANPFNKKMIRRIELRHDCIEAIVFWTRDPRPALPYLAELDSQGFRYYFMTTLTGYPRMLESGAPSAEGILEGLEELAGAIGSERSIWRYDPIYLSRRTDARWQLDNFAKLAEKMEGNTRRVVFSFFEEYRKTKRRLGRLDIEGLAPEAMRGADGRLLPSSLDLIRCLADIARGRGMEARTCSEPDSGTALDANACIDAELIRRLWDIDLAVGRDNHQRPACRCAPSVDIGAYDTCPAGCAYCYALGGLDRAAAFHESHDPSSSRL